MIIQWDFVLQVLLYALVTRNTLDSLLSTKGVLDPHDLMLRFQAWWNGGYNNGFCYDDDNRSKHSVGLGGNVLFNCFIILDHQDFHVNVQLLQGWPRIYKSWR